MALAEKLKYAREAANLTGARVREKTGIGGSSLSEFENGKREPKLNQLQALARLYQRSVAFFLSDAPIPQETVVWRERPAEDAGAIEGLFLRLCEQYHNLELWCGERAQAGLPQVAERSDTFDYGRAESLAKRVHDALQLGDRPGRQLLSVLEEVWGVKVFHLHFEPTGTAASTRSERLGLAVLLNAANVRWRRNFDIAHELFHLLTWHIFRTDSTGFPCVSMDKEEKLATCFARNLLMPPEAVRTAISQRSRAGKISYEALFDIARQFDVSIEALMFHAHMLYNRPPEEFPDTAAAIEKAKALAPILEDREREDTPPAERPDRFRALAVEALWRGELSIGRFAEYMGISRQRAIKYVEQEVDACEEIPIAPAGR